MFFVLSLAASATTPPTCSNLLALDLMVQQDLDDCHASLLTLGTGTFAACDGLTPNDCVANLPVQPLPVAHGFEAKLLDGHSCADGSPAFYFKSTSHTATDEFLVRLNGHSGRCEARWDSAAGVEANSAAQNCMGQILKNKVFTGAPLEDPELTHVQGVLADGGPFTDKVRVWVPSCSNDNYQGRNTLVDQIVSLGRCDNLDREPCTSDATCGVDTCVSEDFTIGSVYSQGHEVVKAVLDDLAIPSGSDVTIIGTSGGSGGLTMTLDALAAHVPDANVIGILDSNQEASVGAFEAYLDVDETATCTVYDKVGECTDTGALPSGEASRPGLEIDAPDSTPLTFDGLAYRTPGLGKGGETHSLIVMDAQLDASCLAHHTNPSACRNSEHVRNHHIGTPVLVVQSLRDKGLFGAGGSPNPVEFASLVHGDVTWADLESDNAPAVAHLQRSALWDFYDDRADAHGEALGTRRAVWATLEAGHELTRDDPSVWEMHDGTGCVTLLDALGDWIDGSSDFGLVDGRDGVETDLCP